MIVDRMLETDEHRALFEVVADLADRELAPFAAAAEAESKFPREVFRTLGRAGLLSLPFAEADGGGGQSYETYLQVLEEIGQRWASVAVGVSVHSLSCHPVSAYGSPTQRAWLPQMLGGDQLGAYCLSEPQAGSDPAAIATRAEVQPDGTYRLTGTKAWVTHGGEADFYNVFARLPGAAGEISCFFLRPDTPGLSFATAERKMGLTGSTTASVLLDDAVVGPEALIGAPGEGLRIAFSALDSGRLGIAACAIGLAQAALNVAVDYARQRQQFGRAIIDHQGLGFLLADMVVAVDSARATMLDAARRRDAGRPFSRQASTAKLVATDAAMKVTTDAVQVLGGYGYTRDFPVERYMREAKIMQIFEGTNQIQRLVISRQLARG
ncbi:MAG: acyl-CoA dehydrogenase domain protein [Pseudonocardiales bacterium]|nr:acyl-CoA dehydrogenase domain protein [Pseudonocardiales bacterium]